MQKDACRVISVCNQKGGVSKSTTVLNLGIGLAREGKKVLIIDNDPQGSLTASLGYGEPDDISVTLATIMTAVINEEEIHPEDGILHHEEGVDLLPGNIDLSALEMSIANVISREVILKEYIDMMREHYEIILIDCIVDAATSFNNDRQKIRIEAMKSLEQDETFGIGMNGEIKSVSFGLYAKEEIKAADGSVIPADGLIEIAFCAEDGSIVFQSDVPFGKYYVKEYATDEHYLMSGTSYVFEFAYAGQEISTVKVALKDGEAIENALKRGKIEGYKVDGEDKGLAGATFGLFDEWATEYTAENAYMTVVSDETGYFAFENVPVGDYVVVELEAPEGYVRADARHFVSVTYDTQVIGLKAINYLIVGSVQLTKVDEEYPENKLAGAVFEVFTDSDKDGAFDSEKDECLGTLTEVNEGVYEMEGLLYGDYFVKEKTAPEGFLLDENVYPFSIVNDKEVVIVENEAGVGFKDQPIKGGITIFKTDEATGDKLVGAGFRVFDANGEAVAEGYTGEDGTVTFELRYGEYTVAEFAAPEGYVLDDAPYAFGVKEHGQKISVDMANTKIKGKLVISKVDAETEELLPGAGFRIYDVNGEVIREGVTDKEGNVEFDLEFGTYYYQEFDAPDGYEVDDVAAGKQSQKMHGRKCPVCGNNYFTRKTISLYPKAYRVENEIDAALAQEKSEPETINVEQHQADKTYIKDRVEFLFIDMEWNQKAGTKELEGREPIQIGLLGADANLEKTKLFSKGIRVLDVNTLTDDTCKITHACVDTIMQANSLEEVFKRVNMSFPKFKYVVVWTKDTYDLFVQSAKQAGVKLPKHRVLVLQDIIGLIATSGMKKIGFETVLTKAEIQYNPAYLHFSKHDVQYLFALYKKIYADYQKLTTYESGVVNEKTRVIHTSECRYAKHINGSAHPGVKALVFRGFRACNCCGSELNLRKIHWIPTLQEEKSKKAGEEISEAELRNLPLTESNIKQICNRYSIKCNISAHILFLTTNCGYWRLYIDGEKVNKVLHGNYKTRQCDHKKKKKCNEGFHQQKIAFTNFYDVVRYIYHHDKNLYVNCKKSKVEILLDKIAQERKMNERLVCN